jgi:hypothetical protein
MADRKTAGFRRVCFQLMGEATTALQHFHGNFLSRRRQSTSVNGVCQALTTTSCILRAPGGIKDHNSPILLVENAGNPHHSRARTLPGRFGGPRGIFAPARRGEMMHVPQMEATRPLRTPQGVKPVHFRWIGVGVVENRSPPLQTASRIVQLGQQPHGFSIQ